MLLLVFRPAAGLPEVQGVTRGSEIEALSLRADRVALTVLGEEAVVPARGEPCPVRVVSVF